MTGSRLDDARRLAREALAQATEERVAASSAAFWLGRIEEALREVLDALDLDEQPGKRRHLPGGL